MFFNLKRGKLHYALMTAIIFLAGSGFQCGSGGSSGEGTGWKVWVKTSPCAGGRTDWITVAKQNPGEGGGGSFYYTADYVAGGSPCSKAGDDSCTFAAATAAAETIRTSGAFLKYCCRDYSVWQNSQSGEMSVVKGMGTAGFGWQIVKGNLCCEEAEELSGRTNICSGPPLGSNPNTGVRRTPTPGGGNQNRITDGGTSTPFPSPIPTPIATPMQTPTISAGRWTLVSVTVTPATPDTKMGWNFSGADATSASITVYQGDKHFFQWTRPPQVIDESGFSLTGSVQCQSASGCATLMNLGGSGIESDTPRNQWVAEANGKNGVPGNGQKNIYFKPSPGAGDLEVEVGLQWGAVRFKYKYRRE